MKIYNINGREVILHNDKLFVAFETEGAVAVERSPKTLKSKPPSAAAPKGKKKLRSCGKCGKPGHNAKTCESTSDGDSDGDGAEKEFLSDGELKDEVRERKQ